MKKMEPHSLIIGVDFSNDPDNDIMIVGKSSKKSPVPEIINAFQGEEARELYNRLVTKNIVVKEVKKPCQETTDHSLLGKTATVNDCTTSDQKDL